MIRRIELLIKLVLWVIFFAYPEEAIELMENKLVNTKIDEKILNEKISLLIKKNNIQFIGLDAEGLTTGILMCLK